jgi:hypothetical protein
MARYIDADKFLQDEMKRCGCVPLVGSCTTDNESLAYQLAKASTADVAEVKHGEWETTDTPLGRCCVCSVCGSCPTLEYNYCPYCGAKMDGGKAE